MKKFVVCPQNAPWGVIKRRFVEDKFPTAITFDSWELKKEYIQDTLFQGFNGDWENLLMNDNKNWRIAQTASDSMESVFRVSTTKFNEMFNTNYTTKEISELDCIIMWDSDMQEREQYGYKDKYTYFSCIGRIVLFSEVVEFEAKEDLFFNDDIRGDLEDKDVKMIRGMEDNWVEALEDIYVRNLGINSPLLNSEEFDDKLSDKSYIPVKNEEIFDEWVECVAVWILKSYRKDNNPQKVSVSEGVTNLMVNGKESKVHSFNSNYQFASINKLDSIKVDDKNNMELFINYGYSGTDTHGIMFGNEKIIQEGVKIGDLKNFEINGVYYENVLLIPVNQVFNSNENKFVIAEPKSGGAVQEEMFIQPISIEDLVEYFQFSTQVGKIRRVNIPKEWIDKEKHLGMVLKYTPSYSSNIQVANLYVGYSLTGAIEIESELKFFRDDDNYNRDVNSPYVISNESKMFKGIYSPVRIMDIEEDRLDIMQEYTGRDTIYYYVNTMNFFMDSVNIYLNRSIDNDMYNDVRNNMFFTVGYDSSILQKSSDYNEIMARNSSQLELKSRFARRDMGLNVMEALIAGGNPSYTQYGTKKQSEDLPVIGGLANIVTGLLTAGDDIKRINAYKKDLKNAPYKVIGTGNNEMFSALKGGLRPYIQFMELYGDLKYKISQYFNVYGHNLNGKWDNPNKYLNARYHWDFFQAQETFPVFKKRYSPTKRLAKSLAMQEGITIFHYRNKKTWKGINYFNINNVELKYAKV